MPRFSKTLFDHARYPLNQGAIENAQFVGRASLNGNPPYISIFLSVPDDQVIKAGFESTGCGVTMAVCSATTELLVGKTINQCMALTEDEICESLEGVPPDKRHCVRIVLQALSNALQP